VLKINFHGAKNQFFPCDTRAQISVPVTRALGTLSFDWFAFAAKLVFGGQQHRYTWEIARELHVL